MADYAQVNTFWCGPELFLVPALELVNDETDMELHIQTTCDFYSNKKCTLAEPI